MAGPRVVGIVQARMGSSRLPGKVLHDIAGHTMLERVVARLRQATSVDEVVIATSVLPQDDVLVEACETLGVRVGRGDPHDLLSRYARVAESCDADVVVRVTSDCPFVDPDVASAVVDLLVHADGDLDYAANTLEPRTFPRGLDVEAMTVDTLLDADRRDRDPGTREHVTPFVRDSGRYRLGAIRHEDDLSAIRWTVDTDDDLAAARALAGHFDGDVHPPWPQLLAAWLDHPEWERLNRHVRQKPVERTLGP
jgi:spore coat polysaccharide biosynthesis protein SpsF (cytidylyltransferase family)